MESLLVSPLVEVVLDKLASGLWKELRLLGGVKKDVGKLQSTLSTINDVLEDAEQRSISDKALLNWLKKLKDAAYDADDVVDELQTEALRAKARDRLKEEVTDFFSSHNPIVFRHKIALKIKDVLERLNAIAEERTNFHLAPISAQVRARSEETHSVVIASEVYGRDEDKETIVNYLLNEDMDKILSVIAVIGLGGIGKTTLAQLVYTDERIKSSFDIKAWVCVSDKFDVKVIARKIIQCIKNEANCNDLDLDPLGQLLQEILGGKRFILVLDDVWNEDPRKWERLKSLLSCGMKGSKIIVTTRSDHVASVMNSVLLHRLMLLSPDYCWKLFREGAFGVGKEEETPRLIEIGKKIVNKGGGLPLAAKALGSLMGYKRGESEWLAIENSEIWRLSERENEILPALRLSYYYFPSQVKKCFVYCSLFYKDHVFDKERLIRLWLGECLIQSSSQGTEYFDILLRRSFFDVVVDSKMYKMHDLIHDLACSVGKDEFCRIEVREDEVKVHDNCRYLSMDIIMSKSILRFSCETKKLRSLLLLIKCTDEISDVAWDKLLQLNCIRLLDLSSSWISLLPSTMCRLKHLRFLDLSYTNIKTLPPTIGRMYNLSTLILAGCFQLRKLPSTLCNLPSLSTLGLDHCRNLRELPGGMSKMNSLIHLDMWGCDELREMPPGMGRLTNLQTMSKFVVGEEGGCAITELKHLNLMGGRLQLWNLHKVKSPAEAEEANLRAKIHVKGLELRWGTSTGEEERGNITTTGEYESIFENLHLPPYLKVLSISGYNGVRLPSWMMTYRGSSSEGTSSVSSLFRSLVSLELFGLRRCEGLPTLGHLSFLKRLTIVGMDGVTRMGGEEFCGCTEAAGTSSFPKLEVLELSGMRNLAEWVVEAGEIPREAMFPSLRRLDIMGCPKLRVVGFGLPMSLVNLDVYGRTELPAGCFVGLSRLRHLTISMSAALVEGGLRYLTALESLEIVGDFDGPTTCLPDAMLECRIPSLQSLCTWDLVSLTSLGAGDQQQQREPPPLFASLCKLVLRKCEALTVLPEWLGRLTSLHTLMLANCPKLEMLPDGLQHLTALRQLDLYHCEALTVLPEWLGRLTSLQTVS